MESPTIRQRATLSDQLSSVNLRDLLKFRDDAVNVRQNRTTLTLASVLEAEKHATATGGGRTLLDVIQEEDSASSASSAAAASSRWHELRDRIRFRPSATRTAGSGSESRVSLMALMELREREEEMDGADADVAVMSLGEVDADVAAAAAEEEEEEEVEEKMAGREVEKHVCCVCMVRKKGAAFIPCGHTFCRACGRELFVGRGCCPLCNAAIAEVLHIF